MSLTNDARATNFRSYRIKLLVAMMVVVASLTSLGIYVTRHRLARLARDDIERDFKLELTSLDRLEEMRNSVVADRSNSLAQNARLHAALEDNALDLLYPSAQEELRDLMKPREPASEDPSASRALFYRFLDERGAVIAAPTGVAGALLPNEQSRLALPAVPDITQRGYLFRRDEAGAMEVDEIIAVPFRSTENNEVIAALVLGFPRITANERGSASGMKSGILLEGKLLLPAFDAAAEEQLAHEVERQLATFKGREESFRTKVNGQPLLLFFKQLNRQSHYPPAYEVCAYPLAQLVARQRGLRAEILGAGGLLLLGGFAFSHFLARRLSQPVEQLAVASEENLVHLHEAEAQLHTTTEELKRSARFSADASHQLKSPITVLRVGLDSLLARDGFPPDVYEEISSLIHQTYRLTGVVEDLLLLSRMDAGKLRLNLQAVDLAALVAEWIDDLEAMPEGTDLKVESEIPSGLQVAGEKKFTTLIVQNLLDNARKYNRRGGIIRIRARCEKGRVNFFVANTGRGIPPENQRDVFERFHRAGNNEDVPGHGLGLNLSRALARLHGGDIRLVRSDAEWTEFQATFLAADHALALNGAKA